MYCLLLVRIARPDEIHQLMFEARGRWNFYSTQATKSPTNIWLAFGWWRPYRGRIHCRCSPAIVRRVRVLAGLINDPWLYCTSALHVGKVHVWMTKQIAATTSKCRVGARLWVRSYNRSYTMWQITSIIYNSEVLSYSTRSPSVHWRSTPRRAHNGVTVLAHKVPWPITIEISPGGSFMRGDHARTPRWTPARLL